MHYLLALLFLVSCSSQPPAPVIDPVAAAGAPTYSSLVLDQVAEHVRTHDKKAPRPVVLFDLDDTLFDVRTRNLPIFQAFAADAEMKKRFPEATAKLERAKLADMRYEANAVFAQLDVRDIEALETFKAFWKERFFSNACANDDVFPGAVAYTHRLHKLGAHIVYMSGRDIPNMKKGTLQALTKRGFPMKNTTLVLKPEAKHDDFAFKQDAIAKVKALGTVVAAFENEPRNLNMMGEAFPKAVLVFLDTQHSPAPDAVTQEAHWVKNYLPTPNP